MADHTLVYERKRQLKWSVLTEEKKSGYSGMVISGSLYEIEYIIVSYLQ